MFEIPGWHGDKLKRKEETTTVVVFVCIVKKKHFCCYFCWCCCFRFCFVYFERMSYKSLYLFRNVILDHFNTFLLFIIYVLLWFYCAVLCCVALHFVGCFFMYINKCIVFVLSCKLTLKTPV